MANLFIINEIYTYGFKTSALQVASLFAILSAIVTIVNKNPIGSVLFLIGLFGNVSTYLLLLGLNFIGLSYLIVYIGAVSILFLFILMLINIRVSELQSNTKNSIALASFIAISFSYYLYEFSPSNDTIRLSSSWSAMDDDCFGGLLKPELYKNFENDIIFFVTSSSWDGNLIETSHISSIGNILYTSHSMWLILASSILLLAMIGAIVVTIKSKKQKGLAQW